MEVRLGQLVISRAGRDKGCYYIVVRKGNGVVWVADGEKRTYKKPKKKNRKHVWITEMYDNRLSFLLESGKRVSDDEIRAAIERLQEPGEEVKTGE